MPCVQHPITMVRNEGVICLGLYCLLGLEAAKSNFPLLLQVLKHDREFISLTSLKVIFDLLLTFGIKHFVAQQNQFEEALVILFNNLDV